MNWFFQRAKMLNWDELSLLTFKAGLMEKNKKYEKNEKIVTVLNNLLK